MSTQLHSSTIAPAPVDPVDWMKVADLALEEHPVDNVDTVVAKAKEKGRREEEERVQRAAEEAQREAKDKASGEVRGRVIERMVNAPPQKKV
ncbi:hypothetical protein J3A83DRAFT_4379806 [Scleroderma citrinum]